MSKEEFLDDLRSALSGSVSADVINDNLNYYENFINTEIRKGRSEDEVLDSLGNPRLIAKTVIDTSDSSNRRTVEENRAEDDRVSEDSPGVWPWWLIVLVIFIVMIAIFLIINITFYLLPVILVLVLAGFIVKLFRNRS